MWIKIVILSAIQGFTEFLPISSSGHLVILEKFFDIKSNLLLLNLVLHLGTVLSLIFFFWKDISEIWKSRNWKVIRVLFYGFMTTGILGFVFKKTIDKIFITSQNLPLVAIGFLITALLLILSRGMSFGKRKMENMNIFDCIKIGAMQAVAIIPGISRSGSTFILSQRIGLDKDDAFKYSFLLAIPVIMGATFVEVITTKPDSLSINPWLLVLGLIISGFCGILSLRLFKNILKRSGLWLFSLYLILIASILLIIH